MKPIPAILARLGGKESCLIIAIDTDEGNILVVFPSGRLLWVDTQDLTINPGWVKEATPPWVREHTT